MVAMDRMIEEGVKVDAIITDPPYGTTSCKWDSVIPFNEMWKRLNKLIKPNGAIVLFGSEPFSSALRMSNIKNYKYDWVWEKNKAGNFIQANYQPIKYHENISVFSLAPCSYTKRGLKSKYNPQMWGKANAFNNGQDISTAVEANRDKFKKGYKLKSKNKTGKKFPRSLQFFKNDSKQHPTQKPVALMEYLIRTYTNEGETVLDFTMGSGTTGVACKNLNRDFIGIEIDKEYYDGAVKRLTEFQAQERLF